MENIAKQLRAGSYSCVIANKGVIRTFTQRGVADLYDLLKTDADFLKGASIADKVVGKGAAALMVQGCVRQVYADLISEPAHALLVKAAIKVEYRNIVHHIENRDKTDWCPLEKSCKGEERVSEILPIIDNFITKIRDKSKSLTLAVLFATICGTVSAQEAARDTFFIPEVVVNCCSASFSLVSAVASNSMPCIQINDYKNKSQKNRKENINERSNHIDRCRTDRNGHCTPDGIREENCGWR